MNPSNLLRYAVYKDQILMDFTSHPIEYVHQKHSFSFDHAVRHEGYSFIDLQRLPKLVKEAMVARDALRPYFGTPSEAGNWLEDALREAVASKEIWPRA